MSLYTIYAIGLLVAFALGLVWSFLDKQKPAKVLEFVAKLLARTLVLFVLLMIIVGFFALVFVGFPAATTVPAAS